MYSKKICLAWWEESFRPAVVKDLVQQVVMSKLYSRDTILGLWQVRRSQMPKVHDVNLLLKNELINYKPLTQVAKNA